MTLALFVLYETGLVQVVISKEKKDNKIILEEISVRCNLPRNSTATSNKSVWRGNASVMI